jgi:hypothetical protein
MKNLNAVYLMSVLLFVASPALALDEIFRIEQTGTIWCDDFVNQKFNPKNNVDLWIYLPSDINAIVLSDTPTFDAVAFMFGVGYLTSQTSASFYATAVVDEFLFVTFDGVLKFDSRSGDVKSISGTFLVSAASETSCFSSGTFKSVQRLQ